MSKIIIDGVEQEVSEEFKKAFDAKGEAFKKILEKNKKKEEDEEESKKKKDSEVSALQAKVDSLEAEANKESEESKKAKMDAEVNAKVKARLILNDAAKARCSAEVVSKLDSMSDSEVKKAVISTTLKEDSAIKLDEKDETYIDTRFDIVMESEVKVKSDAGSVVGEHIVNARTTKEDVSGVDNTRMENWKKPLSMQKTNSVK